MDTSPIFIAIPEWKSGAPGNSTLSIIDVTKIVAVVAGQGTLRKIIFSAGTDSSFIQTAMPLADIIDAIETAYLKAGRAISLIESYGSVG